MQFAQLQVSRVKGIFPESIQEMFEIMQNPFLDSLIARGMKSCKMFS